MSFSKLTVAVLAATLMAQAATAQVNSGRFQIGACATHPIDTIMRINHNVLTFHESVCTLANPVPVQGTAGYSYIGNCAGEGTQWTANAMLIPLQADTVMRVIMDGVITDYNRCTP